MDWTSVSTDELMQTLATCELDVPPGLPEEIVRRKEETLEPLGHLLCGRGPDGEELEGVLGWATIYALFLLGEIADARSLPALFEAIRLDGLMDGAHLGDYLVDGMGAVLARFPAETVGEMTDLVMDRSLDVWHRLAPLEGLYGIASRQPERRPEVIDLLIRLARQEPDLELATFALDLLARTDCPDARGIWKWAFSHRNVGYGIVKAGEFGKVRRSHPPWADPDLDLEPMDHFDPERLADLRNGEEEEEALMDDEEYDLDGEGDDPEEKDEGLGLGSDFWAPPRRTVEPVRRHKIGRNDPCPCGSGKKYKKCCMGTRNDPALWDDEEPGEASAHGGAASAVYQIKVTLMGTDPPVWRRLSVPADLSLGELHGVIQVAMGWEDDHLHQFTIQGTSYGNVAFGPDRPRDEDRFRLNRLAEVGDTFHYEYDFGDSWQHEVLVEKADRVGVARVRCLDGARACPPEDCGGVWGYQDLLEIIADPKHPERSERMEWLGENFDPDAFSVEVVNGWFE